MKRFWGFLTRPVVSVADAAWMAGCVIAVDALHLGAGLPWWGALAVVWGVVIGSVFAAGFVKGFCRSVVADVKRWRAR